MSTSTSTISTTGGQDFEEVDEFQYLGVLIRADGDTTVEIKKRVMAANRCFYGLKRQLRSKLLTKETKFNIYKTLIRPVLLYGSETWPTTKSDEQLLCTFEHKVLRTILGAKWENGILRRRYNSELDREFGHPNIVAQVKVNRLRWAGHVARMSSTRAPSILFNNDPEGRRDRGRPKLRWIDNVEKDLKALRVSNWRSTAQNRSTWNEINWYTEQLTASNGRISELNAANKGLRVTLTNLLAEIPDAWEPGDKTVITSRLPKDLEGIALNSEWPELWIAQDENGAWNQYNGDIEPSEEVFEVHQWVYHAQTSEYEFIIQTNKNPNWKETKQRIR